VTLAARGGLPTLRTNLNSWVFKEITMEERGKCVACGMITEGYCKQCDIFMCYDCKKIERHTGIFKCHKCGIFHCMTYLMEGDECYQCNITLTVDKLNEMLPGVGTVILAALTRESVIKK
jgi:hypothetical protein